MHLLVSVRSAAEAREAVAGGADIVDAKEPTRGPLGMVDPSVLRAIAAAVPVGMPLSVALGDCTGADAAAESVRAVAEGLGIGRAAQYLKIGFHGVGRRELVDEILGSAVAAAQGAGMAIVAAAYADHAAVGSPDPDVIASAAARQGAEGVLLDAWTKDGRTLLDWIEPSPLRRWVARSGRLGLLTAVAGSLDLATLPRVLESGADIVGVRGAACEGGRSGELRRERVARLREAVAAAGSPGSSAARG
ncbi:MAG TPA: (5-formylfuran-3-yl)methyl phosphate synthase [Gemmatimonadales bacterium]|nr:(5-formylfuran-3-yl)methyl phosphate synthase [Gemmatimonadales bacterium]